MDKKDIVIIILTIVIIAVVGSVGAYFFLEHEALTDENTLDYDFNHFIMKTPASAKFNMTSGNFTNFADSNSNFKVSFIEKNKNESEIFVKNLNSFEYEQINMNSSVYDCKNGTYIGLYNSSTYYGIIYYDNHDDIIFMLNSIIDKNIIPENIINSNNEIPTSNTPKDPNAIDWSKVTWTAEGGCYYNGQYFPPGQAKNLQETVNHRYENAHGVPQGEKNVAPVGNMYWDQNDGYDGSYISEEMYYEKYGYIPS